MIYTPITVTSANYEQAIRENILSALRVLNTKIHAITGGPVAEIDAAGFRINLVDSSDLPQSGLTLQKLIELLTNAGPFLLMENGQRFLTEDEQPIRY